MNTVATNKGAVMARVPYVLPVVGVAMFLAAWGRSLSPLVAVVLMVAFIAIVMIAVTHAEEIAHRVGEPFGTLVLAVSVTVIEVALIVTLMVTEGDKASTLARDTVFAAVMIVCNGVVGLSLFVNARRNHTVRFSEKRRKCIARHAPHACDLDTGDSHVHRDTRGSDVLLGATCVCCSRLRCGVRNVCLRANFPASMDVSRAGCN